MRIFISSFVGHNVMKTAQACPNCGAPLNASTCIEDMEINKQTRPKPGDLTVCLYCSHLMAFDDKLGLRALTDDEIVDAAGDGDILAVMEFSAAFRKHKAEKEGKGGKSDDERQNKTGADIPGRRAVLR